MEWRANLSDAVFGITDENHELFLQGRWFLLIARLGLGGEVHLLDDLAEDFRIEEVFLKDLGDGADFDFRHDGWT